MHQMSTDLPPALAKLGVLASEWGNIRRNGHRRIHRELSERGANAAFAKLQEWLPHMGSATLGVRSAGACSAALRDDQSPNGCRPKQKARPVSSYPSCGAASSAIELNARIDGLKTSLARNTVCANSGPLAFVSREKGAASPIHHL